MSTPRAPSVKPASRSDIAGEEGAVGAVAERDAAGSVTREMDHRQTAVTSGKQWVIASEMSLPTLLGSDMICKVDDPWWWPAKYAPLSPSFGL